MCTPSQPRPLREDEWPTLRAGVNRIFRPEGGDLTAELPLLFDKDNRENLRVLPSVYLVAAASGAPPGHAPILAHAGFVVREASVLRRKIRVACIGAVFTAPEQRRQGLGSRVLADALARARPGSDLIMASGDGGLYRRQGLDPVPPLARFRLPEGTRTAGSIEIRNLSPDPDDAPGSELNAMAALYDGEDVHFVRSSADWSRLWRAHRLVDAPAQFAVVLRAGLIVAYIVAQHAGRRADGSSRPRRILEFAGDREAILDAAPVLAEELLVPPSDTLTLSLCARRGWPRTARQFLITAEALTADVVVIPWYGLNYL